MNSPSETLLQLLRFALGKGVDISLPSDIDWQVVKNLSIEQGVAVIAFDGLQNYFNAHRECDFALDKPEYESLKYDWFGQCLSAEKEYDSYRQAIENLASFYQSQDIPMLLLKGYGLSMNYPIPSHRPIGDIDVYLGHLWQYADQMVTKKLKLSVDKSHEHHSVFSFGVYTVENHYDIVNTKATLSGENVDQILKEQAHNRAASEDIPNLYFPTSTFNAVFLIRHLGQHMAGEKVNLRQLLDWALFIDKHSEEIDWTFVIPYWEEIGIEKFARCINTICIEHLGIDSQKFHGMTSSDKKLCGRLIADILCPEFSDSPADRSTIGAAWVKFRRFFANSWKRKLVYNESLFQQFVKGIGSKFKLAFAKKDV